MRRLLSIPEAAVELGVPPGSLRTAAKKHDLRRTAITWAMQRGADKWDAAGFFGVSLEVLERVYGQHHPDHMQSAVRAMERKL